jgi:hypothetical protein
LHGYVRLCFVKSIKNPLISTPLTILPPTALEQQAQPLLQHYKPLQATPDDVPSTASSRDSSVVVSATAAFLVALTWR